MARVGDKNGVGTEWKAGITDSAGNAWAVSAATAVAGVHGFAVNKGGADTSFPQNRCSQLFYREGVLYGYQIKAGWKLYNGSSWVAANNPRDM